MANAIKFLFFAVNVVINILSKVLKTLIIKGVNTKLYMVLCTTTPLPQCYDYYVNKKM